MFSHKLPKYREYPENIAKYREYPENIAKYRELSGYFPIFSDIFRNTSNSVKKMGMYPSYFSRNPNKHIFLECVQFSAR